MNSKVYKCCAVPQCKNTSIKTPNKVFVYVPNKKIIRDKWLKLARRNPNDIVTNSPLYFCEDHFDLPNDMENYMQYHVMGSVSQVRMKPGCMPHKFLYQPDRKTRTSDKTERPCIAKKRRKMILEECEKQFKEKSIVTEQSNSEEMAPGSSEIMDSVHSSRKYFRKCEICKVLQTPGCNVFMAHFPLDTDRCSMWVKATGCQDLLHIPIAQLHKKKYICGDHFADKDFIKKKKRLRKTAVPTNKLLKPPLTDDMMANFPPKIDIIPTQRIVVKALPNGNTPVKKLLVNQTYRNQHEDALNIDKSCDERLSEHKEDRPATAKRKKDQNDDEKTFFEDYEHTNDNIDMLLENGSEELTESDDVVEITAEQSKKEKIDVEFMGEIPVEKGNLVHSEFKCNLCHGEIVGFRYCCLQCVDWDMCPACEASAEHSAHYVLRIPAPVAQVDLEPIIAIIRDQIECFQQLTTAIKTEIFIKEDPDVVAETEEFDANVIDPILITNGKATPELDMHQENSTLDDVDAENNQSQALDACDSNVDYSKVESKTKLLVLKHSTNIKPIKNKIKFKNNHSLVEFLKYIGASTVIIRNRDV